MPDAEPEPIGPSGLDGIESAAKLTPSSPPSPPPAQSLSGNVDSEVRCVICSYELRGLPLGGRCPECGTSVARSLRGDMLLYSSGDYLATLHRGVTVVFTLSIAQIVISIGGAVLVGAIQASRGAAKPFEIAANLANIGLSLGVLAGWWMFSAPDPASLGVNTGATARQVVRITLVISAAATIATFLAELSFSSSPDLRIIEIAMGLLSLIVSAVGYFAEMRYFRWLAPRIPNPRIDERAKLLTWLGPLLFTVGALACGIGPIVALVMYLILLDRVRRDLLSLRERQAVELVV